MKFVCIECDEPMKFAKNDGLDDDGSLSVNFICPSCEWGVTLLTNPQETQMVRSLGVKIGGSTVPPKPMEMLQTHLAGQRAAQEVAEREPASGSACPFSALVQDVYQEAEAPAAPGRSRGQVCSGPQRRPSACNGCRNSFGPWRGRESRRMPVSRVSPRSPRT